MREIILYSWVLSQIIVLVRAGRTVNNSLRCYQCETIGKDPNAVCPEEDLKSCPNDYAADRCLTSVKRNVTGYYHIIRECALAPCDLPDAQSKYLFKLSLNCDRDRDEYYCYSCCMQDGCNISGGTDVAVHLSLLLFSVIATSYYI